MHSNDLSGFIYSEEEAFKTHIGRLSSLVKIDQKDYSIILLPDEDKISAGEKVAIYLIGRYIRSQLKHDDSSDASNEEVSRDLKMPIEIVHARMKDLRDKRLVDSRLKGKHRISFVRIDDFLSKIERKLGDNIERRKDQQ
jgi:DNA-binding transcriptional ArsR family regulator